MKTIAILVIIATLSVAGYYGYSMYQEQILLEQSVARLQQEKRALEAAKASKDLSALNQFIADHPQSDWLEKAIYERDKLAYHQATETNQISELEKFIAQYQGSQWIAQARNRLKRLQHDQKLQADIETKQQLLELQRQQMAEQQSMTTGELEEKTADTGNASKASTTTPSPAKSSSSSLSSRDRVARALAIYQKQRQQEQHSDTQQKQQDLKEEQIKRRCIQIKDQIAQYNNRRIKWYDLDGSGKRVYLNKKQVSINRKRLREEYNQNCE